MPAAQNWPKALEPYRARLAATEKPFIRIALEETEAATLPPWQSKVGGYPYWPQDASYPVSADGRPLFFLAQINLAETPPLEGFPRQGIVQFFIADDDLMGLDFDDPEAQRGFRVVYHPALALQADALRLDFTFLPDFDAGNLPFAPGRCFAMQFTPDTGLMPESDYRFDGLFGEDFFARFQADEWTVAEAWGQIADAAGHRLGGYAEFTQEDPRSPNDPMELLFQLDSDAKNRIQWGDLGVANFFIRPHDLLAGRLERVRYNWDCY